MTLHTYETLVRQHQDRVYGLAVHLLRDTDEAADVAQDVLVRLWKHRDGIDAERVVGWLLRVTRNACIDAHRKRQAYQRVVTSDDEAAQRAPSLGRSPDAEAEAHHLRPHLRRALDDLGEPYKSLVILRDVQGLSYTELCDALDLPMPRVKVYLHRARKRLRAALEPVLTYEAI